MKAEKLMIMFLNMRAEANNGFSLIEVILSLAIVLIFAFGIIPQYINIF